MSKYESKSAVIQRPRPEVYDRLSNLSRLQTALDALPADQRAKLGDVRFERDTITIVTPQVGEIKFGITDRTPGSRLVFGTASSPVPLSMAVNLSDADADGTAVQTVIDVDIPMMLRPLVGSKMQQAADRMNDLVKLLC